MGSILGRIVILTYDIASMVLVSIQQLGLGQSLATAYPVGYIILHIKRV